jgi:3-hydroxyisobutyrate dehydrogenase-like beta-hydroxyacid dehydrogenase
MGYDPVEERRTCLSQLGGEPVDSLEAIGRSCSRIVLSLPDSAAVEQVMSKLEGVWSAATRSVILDTTTGEPTVTDRLARQWQARQVDWLDATIAGSSQQMAEGEAVVLVGGNADAVKRHGQLLADLGGPVFHTGHVGSGSRMKLVVNLALGLHRAVLAEALALADALGFELAPTLQILKATPAYSRVMDTKGDRMIRRDFAQPQARLAQHLKDVELMLAAATAAGRPLPLTEVHRGQLQRLVEEGCGSLDNSAILHAWLPSRKDMQSP